MPHTKDYQQTVHRLLLHLNFASMELQSLAIDDRLRPELRRKFARLKDKFIDWAMRDVKTDVGGRDSLGKINTEMASERAHDLKLLIDFVTQFENIGEIYEVLVQGLAQPEQPQPAEPGLPCEGQLVASMNC